MSRNGAGTYTLPAGNPVTTGTTISSTWANNTLSDIATALTQSVAKDGQTTPTANLPMGGFKHTGVANADSRDQYAVVGQIQDGAYVWLGTATGTVDVITATSTPSFSAYGAGQTFRFVSSGANTGAATLNINSIGAKSVTKRGTSALAPGDIPSGAVCEVVYDGTQFQLIGSMSPAGAARVCGLTGNVNSTTPLTKFDLAANSVTLRDTSGATVVRTSTGTITCDLGLSGPAANGRDQSGAFTASSSINLFFIWNGATLATIASTASHTTGPTLPNGYTHWCYATTIRWNSSSNIIKVYVRGTKVYYAALNDGEVSIGFSSATETSISTASYVPSNAASYVVRCRTSNSSTGNRSISLKLISGSSFDIAFVEAGGTVTNHFELPNVGNSFIAEVSEATTVTADIYVRSYVVSNGDS